MKKKSDDIDFDNCSGVLFCIKDVILILLLGIL